ncbi:hypothetical protein [Ruminiclostridium cellulolyticum]|uniref:Uncharacterized protein n=1 Tax=Ruminiclostridium cellulolyticum (strain ATCC 35319 / DSM 5812 / JCM 6584 / H10) TaxID=394503 RepID=B8I7G1_RUMCH|nr:hypothetical protein [Ruminiclostridium cellulolyticum]ACL77032.1 hypothetical protein Ccel_2721 [Ruminiclostridium cellulolyticum H10]
MKKLTHLSLVGKLEPYGAGFSEPIPINIKDILKGKTTFDLSVSEFEKYLVGISFDIIASTSDYAEHKTVGYLNGKFYNIEQALEDNTLTDVADNAFDDIDQYTFDIYELVTELQNELSYEPGEMPSLCFNIFSIDNIYIEPEYRNNKFGSCAIILLSDYLKTQFNRQAGYFVLEPIPRYNPEKEHEIVDCQPVFIEKKLNRFFNNLGFKSKGDYLYFNLNYDMQKIYINKIKSLNKKKPKK